MSAIDNVFGGFGGCTHEHIHRCAGERDRWECGLCHARFVRVAPIYEQVEQGLIADHDCPAVYACAAILTDCIEGNEDEENKRLGLNRVGEA